MSSPLPPGHQLWAPPLHPVSLASRGGPGAGEGDRAQARDRLPLSSLSLPPSLLTPSPVGMAAGTRDAQQTWGLGLGCPWSLPRLSAGVQGFVSHNWVTLASASQVSVQPTFIEHLLCALPLGDNEKSLSSA